MTLSGDDATKQMQVQLPPEVQRGVYANQFIVSHTREEFVVDCVFGSAPAAVVNARIIVSPHNARQLMHTLAENIRHYEARFGHIAEHTPEEQAPENTPLM